VIYLTAFALTTGAMVVIGPLAEAQTEPATDDAVAEVEPLDVDRSQDDLATAVDEAQETADVESAITEAELPDGALDGTAGPNLFEPEDQSILRPGGEADTVHPQPAAGEPGTVATQVIDEGIVADEGSQPLPPEELTEALQETSESLAEDGEVGELVEEAQGLDLSDVEEGDEVEELRTIDSQTFMGEDGLLRTELSAEPIFAEDPATGELVEPDASLQGSREGRWRPTAGRPGLSFGATSGAAALGSLSFGEGRSISWRLDGARSAPGQKHDDGVRYEEAFDGVDVEMEATSTGIKETIVLADATAPTSYDFPLDLNGVDARLDDPFGSVVLSDIESGEPVGVIPSAWAMDASGPGSRGETPDPEPVAYELVGEGADAILRVTVDTAWLKDPARMFPVRVDPNVNTYRMTGDSWVHSASPNTNFSRTTSYSNETMLKTGGGDGNRRTFFARWDVGWLAAASIIEAEYKAANSYSYSCTGRPFQVYRVTGNWNEGTVNWNNQPSFSGLLSNRSASFGYSGSCPADWFTTPMTSTVQRWVDGAWPAYGVTGRVSPNDSYNDSFTYKEFLSSEWPSGGGGQQLQITWSPWRVRYTAPASFTPPTATQPGSIVMKVTNLAPTTWKATGTNRYRLGYHVYNSAGTLVTWNGGQVDLPQDVSWRETVAVTVPISPLALGNHVLRFDMLQSGINWFSEDGVRPDNSFHPDLKPLQIGVSVGNTPPGITSASPAGQIEDRTPTLVATGINPDNFPSGPLEYAFFLCEDEALSQACQLSPWQTSNRWTPSNLKWSRTYWWQVAVRETGTGALATFATWKIPLTPTLAQPALEKHFGDDPYAPLHKGVNPSIGNYVTTATDVHVAAAGLPIDLTRTYNSLDERVGAFGPAWSTFLDLSAEEEAGNKLLVSFPDGHQERYGQNPDGSWVAGPGSTSVLRLRSVGGGGWELTRPDHSVYVFDNDGRPTALRDAWGNELTLVRDPGSGLVEQVTNEPSGRTMELTWADDGPDGADVIVSATTDPATSGGTVPEWTYGYDGDGRLAEVCAPGEPETEAQCTEYAYHASGQGAEGRLHTVTRQEGNVAVELDYRPDGSVAWVENGEDDRWTFNDDDDAAEGTYHPLVGAALSGPGGIGANATITLDVTGSGGVPNAGVQAVAIDVGAAGGSAGYLSLYPNGTPEPPSISLVSYFGEPRSTLSTVAVGDSGSIKVTNHGPSIFVDFQVVGWYGEAGVTGGSVFVPLPTTRIFDTRVSGGGGPIGAGQTRQVQMTGVGGVPDEGVVAVAYDLTGIQPTVDTNLTAHPVGSTRPSISTLTLAAGRTVDNLHATQLGTDGKVAIYNASGSIDATVNVVGYFADPAVHDGSVFRPVTNQRILDTRRTTDQWTTPWPASTTRALTMAGAGTLPTVGVTAVVGEIQGLSPTATNPMRTSPTGTSSDGTTYTAQSGLTVGNSFYTGLGDGGAFDVFSTQTNDVVVEVVGYFTPLPRTTFVEDPRGNTVEYRYDSLGRLTGRIDEDANASAWAYDDKGFVASMRDAAGEGHVYAYDDGGHVTEDTLVRYHGAPEAETRDWASTTRYGYVDDATNSARDGKLAWVSDGRSADADDTTYRTTYAYDAEGLVTSVLGPPLTDGGVGVGVTKTYTDGTTPTAGCSTGLTLGPAGFLRTETDASGLVTKYCYDAKGDLREVRHPSGLVDRYVYDDLGRSTSRTTFSDSYPSGVTASTEYDARGRVVRELGPPVSSFVTGGQAHRKDTHTSYTPNGNVDRVTLADAETDEERWVESSYDGADRVVDTIDNADRTTHRTYDQNGNIATDQGVDGNTVAYHYNARNLVSSVTALDVVDDPIGAPGTTRDVVLASYLYDAKGRQSAQVNATGETLHARWSPDGNLEHSTARAHQGTDADTGLPAGPERTVLTTAAEYDEAGNATRTFAPSNVGFLDELTSSSLGSGWQTSGSWSVAAGELSASAAGAVAWRPGAADGQVGITVGGSPSLSAIFRVQDAGNYFRVVWQGSQVVAQMVTGGVPDDFDTVTAATALAEDDRVEVNFAGDRLRVLRNGALVMETTVPADTPGTGVGVTATASGQSAERFRFDGYLRTENVFDAYGRTVASTVDPGGAELRTNMALLPDGRPRSITVSGATADPTQVAETRFTYSTTTGWLTATDMVISRTLIPNPDGEPTTSETVAHTAYTYDQRGLVTQTVSPEGAQVDVAYDELGQPARETGPARDVERYGQSLQAGARPVTKFEYNAFGDQTVTEDPLGRKTTATLDDRGFPETLTLPSYTAPGGSPVTRTLTNEYDDAGRVTSRTDALGETTELTYNTLGLVVAQTDPAAGNDAAGIWRYVYDDAGRLLEQRDPTGAVSRQRWDDLGRVTGVEEVVRQPAVASNVTGVVVGDAGQALRSHTAEGVVSTSAYDLAGRLTSRADADGNATAYGYDALGRLAAVTAPDGRRVEERYDLLGRVTGDLFYSAADALLGQTAYSYDGDGHLLSEASPRGVAGGYATAYEYDDAGQLTRRTTPVATSQSILETWGYDALGETTRYTDGRNNTTWQTYNSLGLPEDAIEPAAGPHTTEAQRRWRNAYDANGNVTSQQSPGGVTVTSTYDELGRMTSQAGSGAQAATTTRSFDYDPVGNMLSASLSGGGTQSFTYDDRGLMLTASGLSGSSTFAYDGDGRIEQQTDSSGTTQWSYDDRGLPASMTSSLAGTANYTFDESGRPETVDYGSGTVRTYTYDGWGRVDTDVLKTGSTVLYGLDYDHDLDGNIASKAVSGTSVPAAGTNGYAYDRASRLTSWTKPGGAVENYTWDAASNRTAAGATTATYDEQNRLTTVGVRAPRWSTPGWRTARSTPRRPCGASASSWPTPRR
jgi:YD repeat-containing protein